MWDMGETTLSQLIMEYGATDFLYVIPQELSGMKSVYLPEFRCRMNHGAK